MNETHVVVYIGFDERIADREGRSCLRAWRYGGSGNLLAYETAAAYKSDIDELGKGKLVAVEELEKHHLSPYVAVICAISFVMFADYLERRLQKQ
ncbi:hypothetical protein [Thermaerobacillus caldiproteolyticus]|uniref:hypothetical protein n=1 Tax=Thermaerobacillus caldiproteolyticus TaxID=247480 RepID=UPI00188A634F|nr:hypothetical protein [Anoxybacillus caldiproteolyticus]QPA32433.1 hypothetical protein ISX45_05570 [Anoxybacillus caldiproteolyticus]